jgi:hypothetical protein
MAEPMHARVPARQPANRRPRIPHPHLTPPQPAPDQPDQPPAAAPDSTGWTRADIPLVRSSGRSRRSSGHSSPTERVLSLALHLGLIVNLAAVLAPRLLPAGTFESWSYGGDDFLLAATVLLSGYALLAAGRLSRRKDGEG